MPASGQARKIFNNEVRSLAAAASTVVDTRGMSRLTIITGTGATATVSRVDSANASSHTTGTENSQTVTANTKEVIDVDWPFYRVSSAGGATRVAAV